MSKADRRELLVSKAWVQTAALVILCGFFVMGLLTYSNYMDQPPVPKKVVGPGGRTLFTGRDVSAGQQVFLHNGLMEYGSAFGHGAYLGPDYTADYLRRASNLIIEAKGGASSDGASRRTIAELSSDYVRTARAKGASETRVMVRHVLRNALIPVITVVMLSVPTVFAGAVVIEQIFAWPGMGQLAVAAVERQDFPVVIGFAGMVAVCVLISNLIADVLYTVVDPRVRLS